MLGWNFRPVGGLDLVVFLGNGVRTPRERTLLEEIPNFSFLLFLLRKEIRLRGNAASKVAFGLRTGLTTKCFL